MSVRRIELRGVRVHNLKDIDVDIPLRQLVAVCGVSGSGKTSLAIDTLYAEGQRRYIESFSAYARQFLEQFEKPAAERIDGIPPAIAVTRGATSRSNRSTVSTATEVADYLRLLFARAGVVRCDQCGKFVGRDTPQSVVDQLAGLADGRRFMVAFPRRLFDASQANRLAQQLQEDGFVRAIVGTRMVDLTSGEPPFARNDKSTEPERNAETTTLVVVDRLVSGKTRSQRLLDSLEVAFTKGEGQCTILLKSTAGELPHDSVNSMIIDAASWQRLPFSRFVRCETCDRDFLNPDPKLLNFNSPLGACPTCEGAGNIVTPDSDSVLPGKCPTCAGDRLCREALAIEVAGKNIAQVSNMEVSDAREFLRSMELEGWQRSVAEGLLDQIDNRLAYLESVGLAYLQLDRTIRTLSGGEAQRVALTSALGSNLVNMLYVLDEPSVGLHPQDIDRLLRAICDLRDRHNTVIVVEHEELILRSADHLIEIGPEAGERGGQVVFEGSLAAMESSQTSLTGDYLFGRRGVSLPSQRRTPNHGRICLYGAHGNNLKNLTVEFPLGTLCLVTGVSGAGKSTLVQDTLYPAICQRKRKTSPRPLPFSEIVGDGQIDDVVLIDQSPIGRSPRSNPVTYIKAFDHIRAVFADTIDARTHNYSAGHFSFNVDRGRCTACKGDGYLAIDMQFLADVYMKCQQCRGARYRPEILEVTYRSRNIAEVLDMTVRQAFSFFRGQKKVQEKLKRLIDVGLAYLRLGQPANTLSSGEAQRLKLATYMSATSRTRTLFILDEPTTGLHFSDIVKLLDCFDALLNVGHSMVIVEHNLQMMKAADHIIDLGPGASTEGGTVVVTGTPEEIASHRQSATGAALAEAMGTSQ